jgi:hypothetical protein
MESGGSGKLNGVSRDTSPPSDARSSSSAMKNTQFAQPFVTVKVGNASTLAWCCGESIATKPWAGWRA